MTRMAVNAPEKLWKVGEGPGSDAVELARSVGVSPILAQLIIRRGLRTPADVLSYLSPSLDLASDPFLLADCEKAVDRINYAIENSEKIFVHGDYDVDGITSVALLTRVLRKLGASVIPFVPSRSRDGYGVQPGNVDFARESGAGLLLSCDCGITAHEACERAKEIGLDMVVTDHHEPQASLPDAFAVVNPKRRDCRYPFKGLAGVGVAYKICQALCVRRGVPLDKLHRHFLDLVALGTVADVVPLLHENRAYVYHGLRSLPETKKVGIRALASSSGVNLEGCDTEKVGFYLGPRINAAGRLAEASEALELMLTSDVSRADELAKTLSKRNRERQVEQERVFDEALDCLYKNGFIDDRVLIARGDAWHPGVVGIVAGKLSELFYRPAIVLTDKEGVIHGSGRSIPGFSLAMAIQELGPDLVRGGGHAMAAGFSLQVDSLDDLRKAMNSLAEDWLDDEALLPRIEADMELSPEDITLDLALEIERMAPFGESNPEPIFVTKGIRLQDVRRIGGSGQHLGARIGLPAGGAAVLAWEMGDLVDNIKPASLSKICYNLRVDRYNGFQRIQLILQDVPKVGQ